MPTRDVSARTALVTGGNRGLGLETGRQLIREGYRVVLTARDRAGGEAAAKAIGAEFRALDVTEAESIAALAEGLHKDEMAVDVLVNNAAITLSGFDGEVARKTIDANYYGPMHVTHVLLPFIPDGGTIVMVSSGVGELSGFPPAIRNAFLAPDLTEADLSRHMESFVDAVARGRYRQAGWPGSAYRVSKAGLNALTRILARDLAPRRIKVNAVCPGWVRTRMGGSSAPRSVSEGARSIVWAATLRSDGPTGGFFRDGRKIQW
ncbi:MAG TPA: SDR family NAD(P)-dependent oxidoreductase [Bauldia sp.]|nr:SDR family NAD(P)-dependent oxidoreductase [Bauldia sp.]